MTNSARIDRPYLDQPADGWTARPKPLPPLPKRAEMLPVAQKRGAKISQVIACAAVAYDVPPESLRARDRHQLVAEARGVACWLLRVIKGLSYPEIGRALGGRDHTTAMASIRKVLRRRKDELLFREFTDALRIATEARAGSDLRTNASAETHQGTGSLEPNLSQPGSEALSKSAGEAEQEQPHPGRETESESSSVSLDVGTARAERSAGWSRSGLSIEHATVCLDARLRDRRATELSQIISDGLDSREEIRDEQWGFR